MGSKRVAALRRLEAHNACPGESNRRERESHSSRHSQHESRSPSNSCDRDDRLTSKRRSEERPRSQETRDEAPSWAKELMALNKDTDRRLKSLKDEVKENGKRVSRKREHSPVPDFKYKRNRTQYKFNRKVLNTIETALETSDDEERDQSLTEGKTLICERNKHIKLAEKFGWETVECYVDEPLASDSEDEKRIRRAIKEGKALKEEKRKSLKFTKTSSTASRVFSTDANRTESSNRIVLKKSGGTSFARDGNCFRCGRPGHLARFCKNNTGSPNPAKNN